MTAMPDVSERLTLDERSELWGEHRSRYRFACQFVAGKRVLDAACGTGFGAVMLASAGARSVTGVDLDLRTLSSEASTTQRARMRFIVGDVASLPISGNSIDVVVSFETLEHVTTPADCVAEFWRVLSPGGTLILSTPNAFFYPGGHSGNPYHVHEFTPQELLDLLLEKFIRVDLGTQRVRPGFGPVPFLLNGQLRGLRSVEAIRLIPWKLLNRLPYSLKDRVSRWASGHSIYPQEEDFLFDFEDYHGGHVVMAVCRKEA